MQTSDRGYWSLDSKKVRFSLGHPTKVINTDEMADDRDQGEEIHASYNDERDYVCRTWQLEPKLRFLYWNSALEAPGIDAILQRVSFEMLLFF